MCLSIPAKIISVDGEIARADIGGTSIQIGLQLVDDIKVGDYVLVHTGFALQKIDQQEAEETLQLFKELGSFDPEF
jgi:hydrogenase expression/formation protein HypC